MITVYVRFISLILRISVSSYYRIQIKKNHMMRINNIKPFTSIDFRRANLIKNRLTDKYYDSFYFLYRQRY